LQLKRQELVRPGFSEAGADDGGLVVQGTLIFADPAADAELEVYHRLPDPFPSLRGYRLHLLELDGLVRRGAVLLAHETLDPLGVGDAAVLVDIGEADLGAGLLLLGELPEGAGRAYLPAEGAIVLAVAAVEVEPGGPDSLQARLE